MVCQNNAPETGIVLIKTQSLYVRWQKQVQPTHTLKQKKEMLK